MEASLEKEPRAIGRMFDDIAPSYDLLNHILSMSVDVGWRRKALKGLDLRTSDVVLDIASGTGDMALMAHSAYGASVVGLDLSHNMLREAVGKCPGTYSAIQGDALRMPFPDASFDKAMVSFGIRNMIDIPAFLAEAHRVLRKDGSLAILEFSLPTYPLVRQVYLAYLTRILPFIGGLQSGNRSAYQYLSDSIRRFPSPASLIKMFEKAGFRAEQVLPLTLGVAHIYVLRKQSPPTLGDEGS